MSQAERFISDALNAFDFGEGMLEAARYGCGHVNDTFCSAPRPSALFSSGSVPLPFHTPTR